MRYVPNILTVIRMLLIPVFIWIYLSSIPNHHLWALFIFLLAGFTDFLDGYIARKYEAVTTVGTVLDPLADKLMLLAALGVLFYDQDLPGFIFIIMVIKESILMITGTIMYFHDDQVVIPANWFGKAATIVFTLAIILLFAIPGSSISYIVLGLAVGLKLLAFFSYSKTMLHIIRKKKQTP